MTRIFPGWYLVGISIVVSTVLVGLVYSSFGLFVLPVSAEFALSRASMNTALILVSVGTALVAPPLGSLLDRYSARAVLLWSSAALCIALAALGLSRSLWVDAAILLVVLPPAMLGAGIMTMNVLIVRWFEVYRGHALALSALGSSLASVVVPPLLALALERLGWRQALLASAIVVALILLPLARLIRDRPGPQDVEVAAPRDPLANTGAVPAPTTTPVGVTGLLRSLDFLALAVSCSLPIAVLAGLVISLVPIGIAAGLPPVRAATLMSFLGAGATAGMLAAAYVANRIGLIHQLAIFFGLLALGLLGLAASTSYASLAAVSVIAGLANAVAAIRQTLVVSTFGTHSFGAAQGLLVPLTAALMALAQRFAGEVFDRTGGYVPMLHTFVVIQLIAVALLYAVPSLTRRRMLYRADHAA